MEGNGCCVVSPFNLIFHNRMITILFEQKAGCLFYRSSTETIAWSFCMNTDWFPTRPRWRAFLSAKRPRVTKKQRQGRPLSLLSFAYVIYFLLLFIHFTHLISTTWQFDFTFWVCWRFYAHLHWLWPAQFLLISYEKMKQIFYFQVRWKNGMREK